MKLKPKTVRRLLLLSLVAVLLAGAGGAFFVLRHHRTETRLMARREAGIAAAARGDHFTVVEQLGGYIRQRPDDADALLAYARSRRKVEARDGGHLTVAAAMYHRYLGLRHDDHAARRELLACLADAGQNVEVCDVAKQLRPEDPARLTPQDLEVLEYELAARQGRRMFDEETISLARRAVELAPNNFGARIRLASLLIAAQRSDDADAFIARTAAEFPNDPRVQLLRLATGKARATNRDESLGLLAAVAGLDPNTGARIGPPLDDSDVVLSLVVAGFDAVARPDLLLGALEPRAVGENLSYVRAFARRALYSGEYERLISTQAARSADEAWNAPDVLALVGLALAVTDRRKEADAIFDRLARIQGDFRAVSWTMAREVVLTDAGLSPAPAIKTMRGAIAENPIEPIFRARLAELLLDLGRSDAARAELDLAARSPLSQGWARIGVLRARSFLIEDRLVEARNVCLETAERYKLDPVANATLLAIRSEMLERGYSDSEEARIVARDLRPVLQRLSGVEARSIPAELRASLITAVAVAADRGGDSALTLQALRMAAESDTELPAQALARLVEISKRREFGLESQVIERAEKQGVTPATVLVRALTLHADKKPDEALALVKREAGAHEKSQDTAWRVLVPCYLDAVNSPHAPGEWRATLDRFPDDARAHLLALQSRSVPRDPDLLVSIADRLDALSGVKGESTPLIIRLARARALAARPDPAKHRDQLIGLLRAIVSEAPDLLEPRLLLADALLGTPEAPGPSSGVADAIAQLRIAIPLAPNASSIRLRLADILRRAGDIEGAADELSGVAANDAADISARWAAVEALAGLGRFTQAATLSRSLVPFVEAAPTARAIGLARIFALDGRDQEAIRLYTGIAARQVPFSADEIFETADGLNRLNQQAAAEAFLARLAADPKQERDVRQARARLALAAGDAAGARAILSDLTAADPTDAVAWRLLVEAVASSGDLAEARGVLEQARASCKEDRDLDLLSLQLDFRSENASVNSLEDVARILEKSPEMRERAQAIRAYAALREGGRTPSPAALRDLAEKFPAEPALQSVIISDLLACQPPALTDASAVSLQAARRFPAQWQAAADVVRVHRLFGQWSVVLDAAERWQRLTRSVDADLAVGEARLRLGRVVQARAIVEPHLAAALRDPDRNVPTLGLWSTILLADRQPQEARKLLEPILERSRLVFTDVWLPLAATSVPVEMAPAWLEAGAKAAAHHGLSAQIAHAMAWATLASRDQARKAQHFATARATLEELASAKPEGGVLLALAQVAGDMGDFDRALEAFGAASNDTAVRPQALLGVAQVLLARGADIDQAIATARQAVDASGSKDPSALRTLGDALSAGAEKATDQAVVRDLAGQAAEAYAASIRLSGETPLMLSRLARASELAGKPDDAVAAYDRLLALPDSLLNAQDRAGIQNNLAYLLVSVRKDRATMERARDLAHAAAVARPVGAILDTKGTIEALLGNREGAIHAFRQSLADRPGAPGTQAKLAELLATGTDAEKEEARRLVAAAAQGAGDPRWGNDPETHARLERVRSVLGLK